MADAQLVLDAVTRGHNSFPVHGHAGLGGGGNRFHTVPVVKSSSFLVENIGGEIQMGRAKCKVIGQAHLFEADAPVLSFEEQGFNRIAAQKVKCGKGNKISFGKKDFDPLTDAVAIFVCQAERQAARDLFQF